MYDQWALLRLIADPGNPLSAGMWSRPAGSVAVSGRSLEVDTGTGSAVSVLGERCTLHCDDAYLEEATRDCRRDFRFRWPRFFGSENVVVFLECLLR